MGWRMDGMVCRGRAEILEVASERETGRRRCPSVTRSITHRQAARHLPGAIFGRFL